MIQFTFETRTKSLDDMQNFLAGIDREIDAIGQGVLQEIKPELMDALQDAPPRRTYPSDYTDGKLEWTSPLQGIAYWASDGFGAGIPFERSGKLIDSWVIEGLTRAGGFDIIVENTNPGSKYVFGSLAKNVAQAARFQQRFHKITGWPLATIDVQEWLGVAQSLFIDQLRRRIPGADTRFSGRGFTSGRRR
jgi:hypothetical protein